MFCQLYVFRLAEMLESTLQRARNSLTAGLQRRLGTSGLGVLVLGFAAFTVVAARAAENQEDPHEPGRRQLAATTVAFEVTRYHAQLWESNDSARSLVAKMMDDIAASAELSVTWQSRFLTATDDDSRKGPDAFEQAAMQKLSARPATNQHWSADGQRVVSGVMARKSCINCHDSVEGDVLAYVSLKLRPVER